MRQVYNLNLEAVLSVLLHRQLSGTLSASLAANKVLKEPSQIEIVIDRGKIQWCELKSQRDVLKGEDALKLISRMGTIPWIFDQVASNTSRLSSPSGPIPSLPGPMSSPSSPGLLPSLPGPMSSPHPDSRSAQPFFPSQAFLYARVPRKTTLLSSADLSRLPRPHFQVYANANGRYTLAEIAQLLRTTPDNIEAIIQDLQSWHLVTFD